MAEPSAHNEKTRIERKQNFVKKPIDYDNHIKEVILTTVIDKVELAYITSLLDEESIFYRTMEKGVGQYLRIYYGFSYIGISIYINKNDYVKALKIVNSYSGEIQLTESPAIYIQKYHISEHYNKLLKRFSWRRQTILIMFYIKLLLYGTI